ncbi:hypothetical protein [uncultured Aquimarina sp.]|uniref:hypothetical protein n=1 Tax=uncultured Aquimarina sp. TaxID=575652 RepID=UPI002620D229|nr:hypothetical protein [uncultured Aquimarina sp.]
MRKHYDLLNKTSWNEKTKTKFILNKTVTYHEDENDDIILYYKSPQDQKITTITIEDWDFFIFYFEEPTTIKEVASEAFLDEGISSQMTKEQLEEKLYSMVMDRCMYNEILTFYEDQK